ncbi:MAG: penicillin-binding protein [Corynebacterium casei]|nr:transglycosylase domain-containing protein [Corynebacterium casei]MDN6272659.1 penicillin-binding protein [Corynebacterium casei]
MSDKNQATPSTGGRRRRKKATRRWPWIVLIVVAVCIAIPGGMFAYAYSQYEVPEPEELANNQISSIYASDNSTQIARIVPPEGNRTQVSLEAIPDHVENAVLAAEDREFWTNSGFSFTGFARAVIGQLTGNDSAGGGSTVTQQYVKNTLVGNEVSYIRKARELVYSIKMTNEWPKEDILNAYLNTVYFGRNAYGIQAASVAYFDKNVEDLTVEEGAMLAGIIQAPSNWDPAVNAQQSEERWNYVLDGMVEIEALPAEQRAGMQFPHTEEPSSVSAYTQATGANAHIKNQVIAELEEVGITEDQVNTRGLRITTTIDPTVQNASVDAVDSNLAPLQEDARAAAVTIDPSTGAVRGYFGGDEAEGWDYANGPTETGSTFKIMALAAALQQGIPLSQNYSSGPYQVGDVTVGNVNNNSCGVCSIEEALKNSYNTSFMRLQADLENTTQDTADMAYSLGVAESLPGVERTLTENGAQPYEGIVLGQYQTRPLDMAVAMATWTNRGVWHDPYFVQRVETNSGEVLYEHPTSEGERRVSEQVADNVIQAMKPIAAWSNGALAGGRESASKTGTHQLGDTGLNKDTWMIGSTPQLASAVWVGTADNASAINNAWGGVMYGAGAPTQIWKQILDTSLADAEWESFPQATPVRYGSNDLSNATAWDPTWNSTPSTGGTASTDEDSDSEGEGDDAEDGDGNGNGDSEGGGETGTGESGADAGGGDGGGDTGGGEEPAAPQVPSVDDVIGDLQDMFG